MDKSIARGLAKRYMREVVAASGRATRLFEEALSDVALQIAFTGRINRVRIQRRLAAARQALALDRRLFHIESRELTAGRGEGRNAAATLLAFGVVPISERDSGGYYGIETDLTCLRVTKRALVYSRRAVGLRLSEHLLQRFLERTLKSTATAEEVEAAFDRFHQGLYDVCRTAAALSAPGEAVDGHPVFVPFPGGAMFGVWGRCEPPRVPGLGGGRTLGAADDTRPIGTVFGHGRSGAPTYLDLCTYVPDAKLDDMQTDAVLRMHRATRFLAHDLDTHLVHRAVDDGSPATAPLPVLNPDIDAAGAAMLSLIEDAAMPDFLRRRAKHEAGRSGAGKATGVSRTAAAAVPPPA